MTEIADKNTKKGPKMLMPTIILGCVALTLVLVGYSKGQGGHFIGIKTGMAMMIEVLPLLIFAFIVAGMIQVLLPKQVLSNWVGTESGLRGIFIGTIAGAINDVGIITLPDEAGHVAIAVFVYTFNRTTWRRERTIAEVSRLVYDYFSSAPDPWEYGPVSADCATRRLTPAAGMLESAAGR